MNAQVSVKVDEQEHCFFCFTAIFCKLQVTLDRHFCRQSDKHKHEGKCLLNVNSVINIRVSGQLEQFIIRPSNHVESRRGG